MKVLTSKYPQGSFKGQRSDGRYMDDYLVSNLDEMAKAIGNDMTFLGLICSSTYEVRTGKSTLAQQIGEYFTFKVNEIYNLQNTFDINNLVFNSADLMERAKTLPKYSVLVLDENDEIDEHYFSELSKQLRLFFRKSGQLNLFIILIVPNFFQVKPAYAISRSNFLIDVKFGKGWERGLFDFYNYERKRKLYMEGKKYYNYSVGKPNFDGKFFEGYAVDKQKYLELKRKDLIDSQEDSDKSVWKIATVNLALELHNNYKYSIEKCANICKIHRNTLGKALKLPIATATI